MLRLTQKEEGKTVTCTFRPHLLDDVWTGFSFLCKVVRRWMDLGAGQY